MSGTRQIKTKRESIYRLLVESIEDPPDRSADHDVYPFEHAYELFTAGLVVGYIESEQYDGEYEGDGSYHTWVRYSQFADNNPKHVACVELLEKLLRLEQQARAEEDDDEEASDEADEEGKQEEVDEEDGDTVEPPLSWDDIVDYADRGVGVLFGEWNEKQKLDLPQYFSSIELTVEERIELFENQLTQEPTTGNERDVSF